MDAVTGAMLMRKEFLFELFFWLLPLCQRKVPPKFAGALVLEEKKEERGTVNWNIVGS